MAALKLAIAILAIVLVCPAVQAQTSTNPCAATTGTTFVADPPSCIGYIYCVDGVDMGAGNCTSPYEFNAATAACDWASNVTCPVADVAQPADTANACVSEPDGTFLPNNASCASYFVCENGAKIIGTCASGLYFNAATSACDYESDVSCDIPTPLNITAICGDTNSTAMFAQDPSSCESYYYCSAGENSTTAVLAACPDSLYFDAQLQECLAPSAANCTLAPCAGVAVGTFATDDASCASYYYCSSSGAIAGNCTAGTYFDVANQACDAPANVNCTIAATTVASRSARGLFNRLANSLLDFVGIH